MDLIQFKKTQKVHGISAETKKTYCGKPVIENPHFSGPGVDKDITCGVCGPLLEEERRIEEYERGIYDGMTHKEYKAHLKAKSEGQCVYGTPLIHVEGPNDIKNSFIVTPERVNKLNG